MITKVNQKKVLVFALSGTLVSFILEKTIFPNSNSGQTMKTSYGRCGFFPKYFAMLYHHSFACVVCFVSYAICFSRFPNRLLVRLHVPPCIQLFAFVIFGSRAYVNRVITKPPVHTMPETQPFFSVHNTPDKLKTQHSPVILDLCLFLVFLSSLISSRYLSKLCH